MSWRLHCVKRMDYLCNCKSELGNVCNAVEGHCLPVMKIVHHHANGHFTWLSSGHQNVNPSREAISVQGLESATYLVIFKRMAELQRLLIW